MKKITSSRYTIYRADNIEALKKLPDGSVHIVLTDAPYGLGNSYDMMDIMKAWTKGRNYIQKNSKGHLHQKWDTVPQPNFWKEVYRVLKPGGWCLSFFGARTYDIGTISMRMAGFEVKDCIMWFYDVSSLQNQSMSKYITRKNPKKARRWEGWGTSLRPLAELIAMCRKPLYKGSVMENVLKYGVGAINIEGSRIPHDQKGLHYDAKVAKSRKIPLLTLDGKQNAKDKAELVNKAGRFPTHIIIDEATGKILDSVAPVEISRIFYTAKVSMKEREFGTHGLTFKEDRNKAKDTSHAPMTLRIKADGTKRGDRLVKNNHSTIKPLALMRYLVRLVAPDNAIILDPFMGSGSTGMACMLENCRFIGMEFEKPSFDIARSRIKETAAMVRDHPTETVKGLWG